MSGTWANAHDMLGRGEYSAATTLLTTSADELWERGGRLAAAVLILTALEVAPEIGLWERYAPLLAVIEGRFIGAQRDYVEGLVDRDEQKLLDAARELAKQGRVSLATIAFRAAERWARRSKNETVEALARDARRELKAQVENDHFDDRRFPSGGAELSPRELEIATLVAEGLTNREIADEIVVSVRTVESHVHRVLKKFNVDSRRDLVEPLAEYREGTRFEQ
jgi:DNA-binding NarL/FixJ family response regulator